MSTSTILEFFLILFVIYLPIFVVFLFYLRKKNKKYSIKKCVVSLLATGPKPWGIYFNIATSIYGILGMILPICLIRVLGPNWLSAIGIGVLFLVCLFTILVGFFPMNRNLESHKNISYLVYSAVFAVAVVFVFILPQSDVLPKMLQLINYWIIFVSVILFISFMRNKRIEPNPVVEWTTLLSTIAWNLILAVSLIQIF